MSSRITYENKQSIQNDESIAKKNKVTDSDMNEIKEVVNSHADDLENKVEKEEGKDLMTTAEREKLAGIEADANKYVHPTTHSANMITQNATHRFVTDEEKANWNAKASTNVVTTTANGLMSKEDKAKLNDLENYDDTVVKQDISDLESENKYLRELNDSLQETVLDSETEVAESLVVDTVEGIGRINLHGGERQEKREGYNKVDFSKMSYVNNATATFENDVLTIKSKSGTYNSVNYRITELCRKNLGKEMTFSCKNIDTSNANGGAVQIRQTYNDGTATIYKYLATVLTENKGIYTVPEDLSNISSISIYILCNNSSTVAEVDEYSISITKPMLYVGTDDKEYEPYGVMPSLEFSSKIEAVDNSVEISTSNKNLFKETYNEKTATTQYRSIINGNFELKEGLTYTVSFDTSNNGGRVYINENLFNNDMRLNCDGNRKYITAVSKKSGKFLNEVVIKTATTVTTAYDISNVQIELANTNSDFVEHEDENLVMPIQERMFTGDTFEKIDGIWYEKHNWKEIVLDGTENFGMSGASTDNVLVVAINISQAGLESTGYCTHFSYDTQTIGIGTFAVYNNGANIRFCVNKEEYATINAFKAKLSELYNEGKAVKVVYKLKEAEYIKCTSEQSKILDKINTYKDCTIITTDNDLCKVSLRYKKDTDKEIDNLKQAVIALGGIV